MQQYLMGKKTEDGFAPEQAQKVTAPELLNTQKMKVSMEDLGPVTTFNSPGGLIDLKYQRVGFDDETPGKFYGYEMPGAKDLDCYAPEFKRSQTLPEPEMEETPLMAPQPSLTGVPTLRLDNQRTENELAPILEEFATDHFKPAKAAQYTPYELSHTTNWYGAKSAEKACTFRVSMSGDVTSSARIEKMCSFMSTARVPACAYDSGRAEKQCSFIRTDPIKPVNVFNSRLAGKCSFYGPIIPASLFTSGRAENLMREMPPWVEDPEEEVEIVPVVEGIPRRSSAKFAATLPYAPNKLAGASTSSRVEKMCSFMASEPSKAVSVFSSGRAEKQCSFLSSEPSKSVSVCTSRRVEKQCSFLSSEPSKPVSVTTSGRVEKQCSFLRSEPVKAVSVYSSGLAEKQCSFLVDTPSKPVNVTSSGRIEKMCSFMRSEPVKAVSVFNSGLSEKQCTFAQEFDIDKFDLFMEEPAKMCFPEDEELQPAVQSTKSTYKPASAPPSFTSSRAEHCSFRVMPGKAPLYSASRVEKANSFELLAFEQDADQEFAPSKTWPVTSSGRIERMCSFLTSEPSKPVSVTTSGRLEKMCSFYVDTPSKVVSAFTSSRAEKQCTFMRTEPVKAVNVFSSGRAEGMMRDLPAWHDDSADEEWSFLPVLDGSEKEVNPSQPFPHLDELWELAFKGSKPEELDTSYYSPVVFGRSPNGGFEPSPEMSPEARKVAPRL